MNDYSPRHEKLNIAFHFLGFIFGLVCFPILIWKSHASGAEFYQVMGNLVYGIGFLMVFGFSTLYHYAFEPTLRKRMKMWDHISIYYLIAGSYTPFLLEFGSVNENALILGLVWGMAILGTIFKVYLTGKLKLLSTLIYLIMGWLIVTAPQSFKDALPEIQEFWIALGGVFYTVGVVFYLVKRIPYHHAIWHVFVLAGAISHFVGVWRIFQ